MTPILYGHPFASFVWKPLIALYERDVMFTFRMVDPNHPENQARIAELSPTGQFPALIDGDMAITQSECHHRISRPVPWRSCSDGAEQSSRGD